MMDAIQNQVSRMFRRKDKNPYEKLSEARANMLVARGLMDMVSMPSWPAIKGWLETEASNLQRQQNELSADPQWNAAAIVHLNAARQARVDLLAEIENSAAKYDECRARVEELEDILNAAEAMKRASVG